MIRRPPRSTLTATLLPDTTLCRSVVNLVAPFVHCLRHEGWLQQRAHPPMLLTVHGENDQAIEERAQSFSDESAGETGPVPQDSHPVAVLERSEEHTSELQSLIRISYAVFCLKKQRQIQRMNA